MNTSTDNAWLDDVLNDICWSEMLSMEEFNQAKQAILTHIDTVCREAELAEIEAGIGFIEMIGDETDQAVIKPYFLGRRTQLNAQLNPNKDTE